MTGVRQHPGAAAGGGRATLPRVGRRRRGRRHVVGAVALAVLLVWAWSAAPRTVALGAGVTPVFGEHTRAVALEQFGEGGSYVLGYEDGAYGEVQVPVRNGGPLPLTVQGARLTDEPRTLAEVVAVTGADGSGLPLRLGPGQEAVLELTVRFDNCDYYHERALEILDGALVDVTVLGSAGTVTVAFDHPVLVRSPMIVDCPDRVLDRQAKTRRGA